MKRTVFAAHPVGPGGTPREARSARRQTGLLQGAAGIGLWLLHLSDAIDHTSIAPMTLPDNPFVY